MNGLPMSLPETTTGPPLLSLSGVHKSYGGVRALRGADLVVGLPGEVHTLLGENGSGKSTLLGVLSGQVRPDSGHLRMHGETLDFRTPVAALQHGVAMVAQETAVAPHLSIGENVMLGRTVVGRLGVDWPATHRKAAEVLRELGLDYDTRALVASLRPDQRQMVEIARAISMRAKVLILDEPTSSLTDDQVHGLFAAIARLSRQGIAVLFVSHRLDEVFSISDRITVLRDGVTVASAATADYTTDSLVEAMVGAPVLARSAPSAPRATTSSVAERPTVLQVRELSASPLVRGVDLDVHEGEIVGLAGLVGSGRSDVLEAIFGTRPILDGALRLSGEEFRPRNPTASIRARVAYLPPDRKSQGLVLPMSVGSNLSMAATCTKPSWSRPDSRGESDRFERSRSVMRLKSASRHVPVGTLSGGNQQKVALGKWLAIEPVLLLLDEPTRGVDVAAKADIHEQLKELALGGLAVVVSSSENPELLELCDRIVVLFRGRVAGVVNRADADEAVLTRLTGGQS